jgi:ribonuclease HI
MVVTINTDASYSPKHKVGAFAFWIVCDQGKIQKAGELRETHAPHDAEAKSIANAFHTLLHSKFTGISKIVVNTDSMICINRMGSRGKAYSPERSVWNTVRRMKKKNADQYLKIEYRHVKAHSGTDTARKFVNDWCDKEAKKFMRKMVRKKLKNEGRT